MVTSPIASMPSVTDLTLNSTSSLGTRASALSAWQTASTGPVPMAAPVSSAPSAVIRVTVAVGCRWVPVLTCTSFKVY